MRKWLPKVFSDKSLGTGVMYSVKVNPLLSPSLILIDEFWQSIAQRFPGDVLIALPRKDQLFIFDNDAGALAHRLIDATFGDGFNLLSPQLYARRNGKIVAATG